MEMYEEALRNKFRYSYSAGQLDTEDLWDLELEELDLMAQKMNNQLTRLRLNGASVSFIPGKETSGERKTMNDLSKKLDILKRVIEIKFNEKMTVENRTKRDLQKAALVRILHEKKTEGLKQMSVEDLEKKIAEL